MPSNLRLPVILLCGLGLAACETTGSTSTGPAVATPPAAAPSATAPASAPAAPAQAQARAQAPTAAQRSTPPTQSVRGQMSAADRAAWERVIQTIRPQLDPCLQAVYEADRTRKVGEIRTIAEFDRDGSLRGMQVGNADRIQSDADYRFVVETLVQGIQRCTPLKGMPAEHYDKWEYFPIFYRSDAA